jgi:hypothetical protein
MAVAEPDVGKLTGYWLGRIDDLLTGCIRHRDKLPAGQAIDVRFDDFMADEEATLRDIYRVAGQPFDDDVRAAMTNFLTEHPRGRYGGVIYDPADLQLDAAAVAERFRDYCDRFLTTTEDR